jgi:hypothetical protein
MMRMGRCLVDPAGERTAKLLGSTDCAARVLGATWRVDYRGIRYTIRTRIVRQQWSVTIHAAGVEVMERIVTGARAKAELQARSMINAWLKRQGELRAEAHRSPDEASAR